MCGLLGSYELPGFDVSARLELIAHRGPDGSGVVAIGPAVHGHVRLALLDLTAASDQPFRYKDSVLSFNGEIWNYQELREELMLVGVRFKTSGDTEVLAAALYTWGIQALQRVEGMFAFAWSRDEKHILVRDRFGKIPLYIYRSGRGFAWSSERKGLGKEYPAAALPPASILNLTTGKVSQWYSVPHDRKDGDVSGLLRKGVHARLNADAPLCCLISGGLDSTLILMLAREVRPDVVAYTAVLDSNSPDTKAAERVCREYQVPLVKVSIQPPTSAAILDAIQTIEIPSKAQVEIAALCLPLAQAIASDGFKACLSGEAADELFGGYGGMCIKGSKANDATWRGIRLAQLGKMARGNFIRCNKAFMRYGVECRLPFMERGLVERTISMSKAENPPGKKALKKAASDIVPEFVIKRQKETFQGASGMIDAVANLIAAPRRFYRAEVIEQFGRSAV